MSHYPYASTQFSYLYSRQNSTDSFVKTIDLVYSMRKYDERVFLTYRALIQKTFGTSAFLFYVKHLDRDNFSRFSRHYFLNRLTVDDVYAEIDKNITGQNLQET